APASRLRRGCRAIGRRYPHPTSARQQVAKPSYPSPGPGEDLWLVRHFLVGGEDLAGEVEGAGDEDRKAVVGEAAQRVGDVGGPAGAGEGFGAVAFAAFDRYRGDARQTVFERVDDGLRVAVGKHAD